MPGKLKANYNAIKPTARQQKKQIKQKDQIEQENNMIKYLETKWECGQVKFSCSHCLREAYLSVINESDGYVTDEELIKSSGNTLRHK